MNSLKHSEFQQVPRAAQTTHPQKDNAPLKKSSCQSGPGMYNCGVRETIMETLTGNNHGLREEVS
jgi:hypothetical protein